MAKTPNGEGRASRPSTLVRRIATGIRTLARKSAAAVALVMLVLVGIRAYQSTQGPPLRPWHTIVPDELSANAIRKGNWPAYVDG